MVLFGFGVREPVAVLFLVAWFDAVLRASFSVGLRFANPTYAGSNPPRLA